MGFFNRIFGIQYTEDPQPDISFGRYSDSYKTTKQYQYWDDALEKFEEGEYVACYENFFNFLKDENEENLKFSKEEDTIQFEFYQGSKRITGSADQNHFKAHAKIAKADALNVSFMQRLMEQNFDLKYSRFGIDEDNHLTIIFDTHSLDGSPYKLYHALKEIAITADKQDDLLLEEFQQLESVDDAHLVELPPEEKELKHQYIVSEIRKTFDIIDHGGLSVEDHAAGFAYLLLHLVYKLDYLIKPEGYMMETLERANRLYFANDNATTPEKIRQLKLEINKLLERPKEQLFNEMYRVICTFGITSPVNQNRVAGLIQSDLVNMDWYEEHGHPAIAFAVPGYIVGYCMFNYAIPKPVRDFFHLYFKVTESSFFKKLGFTTVFYDPTENKFQKKEIKRAIDHIIANNKAAYPEIHNFFNELDCTTILSFCKSFLTCIRKLDMIKSEN